METTGAQAEAEALEEFLEKRPLRCGRCFFIWKSDEPATHWPQEQRRDETHQTYKEAGASGDNTEGEKQKPGRIQSDFNYRRVFAFQATCSFQANHVWCQSVEEIASVGTLCLKLA